MSGSQEEQHPSLAGGSNESTGLSTCPSLSLVSVVFFSFAGQYRTKKSCSLLTVPQEKNKQSKKNVKNRNDLCEVLGRGC
jgi:hypothetical protein